MTDYLGYTYAVLIAGGGLAGYLGAGSVMALVMGLGFGLLAGVGAYRMGVSSDKYVLGLLVSLAMLARFGQAYVKNTSKIDYGIVAGASLVMVLRYVYAAATSSKKSSD